MTIATPSSDRLLKSSLEESAKAESSPWALLYRIAGIATIVMLFLIPLQIAIFILWPLPATIPEWFVLSQQNPLIGLLHLDLIYVVNNTIVGIMYLAFYLSLRKHNESLMLLALVAGMLAIASYYASNTAFEMLATSRQYAASTMETERAALLAVGYGLIAQWRGTAFDIYYILSAICLLLIAGVMFRSPVYGKTMATIGMISGILMLIPSTAGTIGLIFSLASLVPWIVFSAMAVPAFLRLASRPA